VAGEASDDGDGDGSGRLPRRSPDAPTHPVAGRPADDPEVPVGALLRIREALEERL
jgi:hypothetical protein